MMRGVREREREDKRNRMSVQNAGFGENLKDEREQGGEWRERNRNPGPNPNPNFDLKEEKCLNKTPANL